MIAWGKSTPGDRLQWQAAAGPEEERRRAADPDRDDCGRSAARPQGGVDDIAIEEIADVAGLMHAQGANTCRRCESWAIIYSSFTGDVGFADASEGGPAAFLPRLGDNGVPISWLHSAKKRGGSGVKKVISKRKFRSKQPCNVRLTPGRSKSHGVTEKGRQTDATILLSLGAVSGETSRVSHRHKQNVQDNSRLVAR